MAISGEVIEAARSVGAANGIAPAVLLAVAVVETNALAFAVVDGTQKPLIRFEGHYFDRLLAGSARKAARAAGLSHPRAGAVRNPVSQAGRWTLLSRARDLDAEAACSAISVGLCQIMGSHSQALGYASAKAMLTQAEGSAAGQFEIAARFLALGGLDRLLEAGDHAGFARRYNGPGFRRNDYDRKIGAALSRARALLDEDSALLRIGSRGPDVAAFQRALAAAGVPIVPDGAFGPETLAALRAFQERHGLRPDGVAGPATNDRLIQKAGQSADTGQRSGVKEA